MQHDSDIERFVAKNIKQATGCWHWRTISTTGVGYGKFKLGPKVYDAHRAAYMLFKGPIPPGLDVCHSCDNRACANPDHLWLGTRSANMKDAVVKGRKVGRPRKRPV